MKKSIILALVSVVSALGFVGCTTENTLGLTGIIYYPVITLEGDNPYLCSVGESYVEPGYSAVEGSEDVTGNVVISSNVDANNMGIYSITYSATSADGFSASVSRDVYVYDPSYDGPNPAGTYTVQAGSYRYYYTGSEVAFSGYTVTVEEFLPGFFYVSDYIGGFYASYYGYGSSYAMTGYFTLDDDNNVVPISSSVKGWGDSMDYMENGVYDPEAGTLSWDVTYAGEIMTFYVRLAI